MIRLNSLSTIMLLSVSAIALAACEERKVEAAVFESVQQCTADPDLTAEQCEQSFKEAQSQHAAVAPKYVSEADCQADFGAGKCEKAPYRTSSGGSIFMPLMVGYMMGSFLGRGRGFGTSQPLYRSAQQPNTFRTAKQPERRHGHGPNPDREIGDQPPVLSVFNPFTRWLRRIGAAVRILRHLNQTGYMQRIFVTERPDLARAAAEHSFEYRAGEGIPYWDETAYYRFTMRQIEDELGGPAEEIENMCFGVVERAVNDEAVLRRIGIAEPYWDYVADSWRNGEKNLYGRMDLSYDGGGGAAKLLEYNADTPTALYESAVFQWEWLEQATEAGLIPRGCDQFNELHETIVQAFAHLGIEGLLHFSCNQDIEDDKGTLDYLEECAGEAGLATSFVAMEDIGIDDQGRFTDLDDRVVTALFKLYPWEWIMDEAFRRYLAASGAAFIEPPWKAVLSNKGLLPLLWEMFEGHPNLLPTYFEGDPGAAALSGDYVRKPLYSRQGANIEIIQAGKAQIPHDGPYGGEGHIVQAFHPLPEIEGNYPLVGCWLVASKAVGLCIREDLSLVTSPNARFIPHVILD